MVLSIPDCDDFPFYQTSEEAVNIINKRNVANLTHIYIDDNGVFGPNLLFMLADYDLFPAVPVATQDRIAFGINTLTPNSGPFNNLVFNILTAQIDLTTIDWEYSTGGGPPTGWAALTVQDNTNNYGKSVAGDPFDTTGIRSVHWVPPANWVPGVYNGVTAYWVRAEVNAIGGAPAPPRQNVSTGPLGQQIHTVTWPHTEIDDAQVGGDIPAIATVKLRNTSDGNAVVWHTSKLILGLRSVTRDHDPTGTRTPFEAFVNFGNTQLLSFQQNVHGANTTAVADIEAPSGIMSQYNPLGAEAMADRIEVRFTADRAYATTPGRYRILMRGAQIGGAAGDISVRLLVENAPTNIPFYTSETIATPNTLDWQLFDFGDVLLPGAGLMNTNEEFWGLAFTFQASALNGTPNFNFYDFILMPADEWSGEITDWDPAYGAFLGYLSAVVERTLMKVDSTELPRRKLRASLYTVGASPPELMQIPTWKVNAPGEIIFQANTDQRYWFLAAKGDGAGDLFWYPWLAHYVHMQCNQRYLSMRGSR